MKKAQAIMPATPMKPLGITQNSKKREVRKLNNKPIFSKDFKLVAIGQIISIFGNQMLRYALPLFLLNQTGSSALFGAVSAFSFLPMLILFPIGGIIADRLNKRNIMVALDFCTSALVIMFLVLSGKAPIVPLTAFTLIVLFGVQGAYQPCVKASVPSLVEPRHMMEANSAIDLIGSSASILGPVLAGISFSLFGLNPILYASAACFFASAVMEVFINIPHDKKAFSGNVIASGISDLKESFRFVFIEAPAIWKISSLLSLTNLLLTTLILIGAPVIITQRLGFSEASANRLYGYSQGIMGAGAVLGGLLTGALSKRLKLSHSPLLITGCALSVFIGGIALQVLKAPMAAYTALAISGFLLVALSTVFQIQMMTYIQRLTPDRLIGKVISCVMSVCLCSNPIGQFIYGLAFEHIAGRGHIAFYIASSLMLAISLASKGLFKLDALKLAS